MRIFSVAFLRRSSSLHTHAFFASSPDAVEVGALPQISMETRKANVRKTRGKCAKADRGSLHAEICTSIAEKTGPSSAKATAKAKRKAQANVAAPKATELPEIGVLEAAQNAAPARAEEVALHVFEGEKSVQNAVKEGSMEVANDGIINAKKELSELAVKLSLNTSTSGLRWEQIAFKLLDHGISSAHVKKMLPKCRTIRCRTNSPISTLKHFTMLGMSHEEMGRVISQWPSILYLSNNLFESKVEFFESVGIDRSSLGKIMYAVSPVLGTSLSTLRGRCDFWKDYFQDVQADALHTLILRNPRILGWNLQKTLKPKITYLEELGFSKKMLLRSSSLLSLTRKTIAMKLKLLEQFGISSARNRIRALAVLHRIKPLKLHAQLHNLVFLGFSFDQVQKMIGNYPHLLGLSKDQINLKLSYAVNVMNLSFDALVTFPAFWGYSYENRIKYRHEVLQELRTLRAYEKNISLSFMLSMTDADFSRRFVGRLQA